MPSTTQSRPARNDARPQDPETALIAIRDAVTEPSATSALAKVLPTVMAVERFQEVVIRAIAKDPKLLRCTPLSIMRSVLDAASIGLEPTGKYGGAYLVPFRNSDLGVYEATLIVGYDGMVDLAYRSGMVDAVESDVVYANDEFDFVRGYPDGHLRHVPLVDGRDRGACLGAWAMVWVKGSPRPLHEFLPEAKIEQRRKVSRSGRADDGSPAGIWREWRDEMRRKTALRYVFDLAPRSVRDKLGAALEIEDRVDSLIAAQSASAPQLTAGQASRRGRLRAGAGVMAAGDRPASEEPEGGEALGSTETAADPSAAVGDQSTGEPSAATPPSGAEPVTEGVTRAVCNDPSPFDEGHYCGLAPDHLAGPGMRVHRELDSSGKVVATWPAKDEA